MPFDKFGRAASYNKIKPHPEPKIVRELNLIKLHFINELRNTYDSLIKYCDHLSKFANLQINVSQHEIKLIRLCDKIFG